MKVIKKWEYRPGEGEGVHPGILVEAMPLGFPLSPLKDITMKFLQPFSDLAK